LNAASECEVGANGIDDDLDGSVDESATPVALNPTVAAAAGGAGDRWANMDRDGDGWTLNQERLLGTAPNIIVGNPIDSDPCGGVGSGSDGWPSDLSGNNNILNIADIGSFLTPSRAVADFGSGGAFNMFGHDLDDDGDTIIESSEDPGAPGGPTFNVRRWNLQTPPHVATTEINIGDLGALITGAAGSGARPPMFGGGALGPGGGFAFFTNGGRCPFPAS
jgi:hypothetical protein